MHIQFPTLHRRFQLHYIILNLFRSKKSKNKLTPTTFLVPNVMEHNVHSFMQRRRFYTKEIIRRVHINNKFKLGFSLNSEDLMKLNSSSLTTNSSSVGFETFISKIRRGDVLHFVMKNNNTDNIEYFDCELELHQF